MSLSITPLSAREAAARAKTRAAQRVRDARTALVLAEAEYADAHIAFRLASGEQPVPPRTDPILAA